MFKKFLPVLGLVLASCAQPLLTPETSLDPLSAQSKALSTAPVQLYKARSVVYFDGYDAQGQLQRAENREIVIRVKNLSPVKEVFIRHQMADGTWQNQLAVYKGPADSGYEIWSQTLGGGFVSGASPYASAFCLGITANGTTLWDNNAGKNYQLVPGSGDLLGPGLEVVQESAEGILRSSRYLWTEQHYSNFNGRILLKNLAFAKKVTIVYTLDAWKTTLTQAAQFSSSYDYLGAALPSPNANGVESWTWSLTDSEARTSLEYAIAYDVNGTTYWDNNFGKNYTLIAR